MYSGRFLLHFKLSSRLFLVLRNLLVCLKVLIKFVLKILFKIYFKVLSRNIFNDAHDMKFSQISSKFFSFSIKTQIIFLHSSRERVSFSKCHIFFMHHLLDKSIRHLTLFAELTFIPWEIKILH